MSDKYTAEVDIVEAGGHSEFRINGGDNLARAVKSYSIKRNLVADDFDASTPEGVEVTLTIVVDRLSFADRRMVLEGDHTRCPDCGSCASGTCAACSAVRDVAKEFKPGGRIK